MRLVHTVSPVTRIGSKIFLVAARNSKIKNYIMKLRNKKIDGISQFIGGEGIMCGAERIRMFKNRIQYSMPNVYLLAIFSALAEVE